VPVLNERFFPIIAEWANKETIYGEHENNNKNPQKGPEKTG
jgi:hypothetical protein